MNLLHENLSLQEEGAIYSLSWNNIETIRVKIIPRNWSNINCWAKSFTDLNNLVTRNYEMKHV